MANEFGEEGQSLDRGSKFKQSYEGLEFM